MTQSCRLYLATPSPLPDGFAATLAEALDAGDIAAVRVRLPTPEALRQAVGQLRPIVQSRGVAFIVGGEPGIAAEAACDGVDLLPGEMPVAAARRTIGNLQLGIFCGSSRDRAMDAGEAGADYVAFGPFFVDPPLEALPPANDAEDPDFNPDSGLPDTTLSTDLLAWWSSLMELPVVAEGAITAENCAPLVMAGADFLAVDNAIWNDPRGAAAAVRTMNAAILAAERLLEA